MKSAVTVNRSVIEELGVQLWPGKVRGRDRSRKHPSVRGEIPPCRGGVNPSSGARTGTNGDEAPEDGGKATISFATNQMDEATPATLF